MTFEYTIRKTDFDSSAVEEAYYNENTGALAVVLSDGSGYEYTDVPKYVWENLTHPNLSAGRVYVYTIKNGYGPGEYLGFFNAEDDFFVGVDPETDGSAYVTDVTRSKALSYAVDAKVDNSGAVFPLTLPSEKTSLPSYNHKVDFTVENGNTVKSYNVEATSVDEAVDALSAATAALGLSVNVKGVYVSFE